MVYKETVEQGPDWASSTCHTPVTRSLSRVKETGKPIYQPFYFYHLCPILPEHTLSTLPVRQKQHRTHQLTSLPKGWQENVLLWLDNADSLGSHGIPIAQYSRPPHGQALLQFPTLPKPGPLPFKKYNFIYLFWAVLGLHYCVWVFSSCSKQRPCSSCGVQASHCSGFLHFWARALGHVGLIVVAHELSSCGSWDLEHRLSSCGVSA